MPGAPRIIGLMSRFLLVLALVGTVVGFANFIWFETVAEPGAAHSASLFATGPLFLLSVGYLVIRYVVLPLAADNHETLRAAGQPHERVSARVRIGNIWHTGATVTVHEDRILIDTAMRVHVIMDHQLRGAGEAATRRPAFAVEHAAPDLPSPVLVLLKPHHPVRTAIARMAGIRT